MRSRFLVPAFSALVFASLVVFAREKPWYTQPGTPMTLESSGFVFKASLPQGWSFTTDREILPPPAFASACRLRGHFYTDREWNRVLAPALLAPSAEGARVVQKIGGHEAVSRRSASDTVTVHEFYINLSALQPDSGTVWRFEGSASTEGLECELQFYALINSATITRDPAR